MDIKVSVFTGRETEVEERFNKWAKDTKGYIKDFRVAQYGQYGVSLVVMWCDTPCEWVAPLQPYYGPSPDTLPLGPFGPAITCKDEDPWKGEFVPVGSEPLRTQAPTMRHRPNPAEQFGGGIH